MSRIWPNLASGPRGCLTFVLGIFLLLGLGYWGYCWGWWGRNNLVLQYLLQCRCPVASEAARYRPYKVLASACQNPRFMDLSPSGRFLIFEERSALHRIQRTDLMTHQTMSLYLDAERTRRIYQLDDDRVLIMSYEPGFRYVLLDLRDGSRTELPFVRTITLKTDVLRVMQHAEQVWVLPFGVVVALAPHYKHNPAQSIVFYSTSTAREYQTAIINQLEAGEVAYQNLPRPYTTGPVRDALYSRDRLFWADSQGITLAKTGARIVPVDLPHSGPAAAFRPVGWTSDNRGVVYAPNAPGYLIGDLSDGGYWPHLFPLPQPILLVEVPEAYRE